MADCSDRVTLSGAVSYSRGLVLMVAILGVACGDSATEEPSAERYTIAEEKTEHGVDLLILRDAEAQVQAAVAPSEGGELASLRLQVGDDWIETLYRGRDYSPIDGWSGRGPLLWPATGRSIPLDLLARLEAGDDAEGSSAEQASWEYEGKRYPMPAHGFARDYPWTVESQEETDQLARVTLAFEDSAETREMYPFGFGLRVTYTLVQGTLDVRYDVQAGADNEGVMPFSIGNHITFNTPLLPGSDAGAMTLLAPSKTELMKSAARVPTGEVRDRSHQVPEPLGEWEKRSAVSLTGFAGNHPMILLKDPAGLQILLSHNASEWPEMPFIEFNVWGDALDGFFSPEPWVGMQNSLNSGQGLIRLEPGETFDWTMHLEFERRK